MSRNLWGPPNVVNSNYSYTSATGEIDLREEFDKLLFGDGNGPRHGHLILLRRARRDASNKPIPCTCTTGHVYTNADPNCVYCDGEGYYWDEEWHWTFSQMTGDMSDRLKYLPFGATKVDYRTFYLRYDTPILFGDKIVEVRLDTEGNPLVPYIRRAIYTPATIDEKRLDNGRIEYIAVPCREEDAVRPEDPVSNVRN